MKRTHKPGRVGLIPSVLLLGVILLWSQPPSRAASPEMMRQAEEEFRALGAQGTQRRYLVDGKESYTIAPALQAEVECAELSGPGYALLQESRQPETAGLTRQPPALTDTTGTRAVFVNIKRDFSEGDVRPYVKGGLGVAYDHAMGKEEAAVAVFGNSPGVTAGTDPQDARLAWNLGAGVAMQASDTVQIDAGYRVAGSDGNGNNFRNLPVRTANPAFSDNPSGDATHLFSVGVHIGF